MVLWSCVTVLECGPLLQVQLDITAHHDTSQQAAASAAAALATVQLFNGPAQLQTPGSQAEAPTVSAEAVTAQHTEQQQPASRGERGHPANEAPEQVPQKGEPSPWLLLKQKGIVGALRVAARALSQHGLRRAPAFQQPPHHAVGASY